MTDDSESQTGFPGNAGLHPESIQSEDHQPASGGMEMDSRLLLNNLPETVFILDPDGKFIYASPALERQSGFKLEEILGKHFSELVNPEDIPHTKKCFNAALKGEKVTCDFRTLAPSDTSHIFRCHPTPLYQGHTLVGVCGVLSNISNLKKTELELRRRELASGLILTAAQRFLSSTNWEEITKEILPTFGQTLEVNKISILKIDWQPDGSPSTVLLYEWGNVDQNPSSQSSDSNRFIQAGGEHFSISQALGENLVYRGFSADLPEKEKEFLLSRGVVSYLTVPIFSGEVWWGVIALGDADEKREWGTLESDSLTILAKILGASIENKKDEEKINKLYQAEIEQRHLSQTLIDISTILNNTLDFDAILQRLLEQIGRVVAYDSASLMLVEGGKAHVTRWRGYNTYNEEGVLPGLMEPFDLHKTPNLLEMLNTHQPLVVSNISEYPHWEERSASAHIHSWAGCPILAQNEVIAFISLDKTEPGYYTQGHARLLAAFAGQAGLALQNARLYADTYEALQRERALNETAYAISSTGDLHKILDDVARLAMDLMDGDASFLGTFYEDGYKADYITGVNLPEMEKDNIFEAEKSISWQAVTTGKPTFTNNYQESVDSVSAWVKSGIQASVAVPLKTGGETVGILAVSSTDPKKKFTRREADLLESVGRQAAVAIQNSRLFATAERRAKEAETLRLATSAINSALELGEVVKTVLNELGRVVPYDSATLFLVKGDHLELATMAGIEAPGNWINQKFPLDDKLFHEIRHRQSPLVLADAQKDKRFQSWIGTSYVHGWIGVPLYARNQLVGILTIDSRKINAYTQSDVRLVQAFANEAAVAVENARLFDEVQKLAITDPLTGIFNRRHFFNVAEREFLRCRRYTCNLSLLMFDLDHFKRLNDNYGHQVGDLMLSKMAASVVENLRDVDLMARFGGEEFVILLPETGLDQAAQVAERVRDCIANCIVPYGDEKVKITASIGVTSLDETCLDIEMLVNRADKALYGAKTSGRGRICLWQDDEIEPYPNL